MKKVCIIILALMIAVVSFLGFQGQFSVKTNTEYLRIHIRANSNAQYDQNVKFKVKEKVVEFLTPYLAQAKTKVKAQQILNEKLDEIQQVCDRELKKNGYTYSSKALLRNEKFPTRVYENITLDCGYYDALIIELGEGSGDNWWCVVYPPLCFTSSQCKYEYKSKIKQIIQDFYNRKEKI